MRLEKISAIAELVSSVAIVITLIYLSIQTQQNTNALLAASRQNMMQADLDLLSSMMDYPIDFASIDQADFSADEMSRLQFLLIKALRVREFAWLQYDSGALDEASWQSYLRPMANMFQSERARTVLDNYFGDPAFKGYLAAWLEENQS